MKPSQIRQELLAQHANIRAKMDAVQVALASSRNGQGDSPELHHALEELLALVVRHNTSEEELLKDFIREIDPWGPVRVEGMNEAHEKEHEAISAALADVVKKAPESRAITELFTRMAQHMELEERNVLAKDLFDDDGPPVDSFGG